MDSVKMRPDHQYFEKVIENGVVHGERATHFLAGEGPMLLLSPVPPRVRPTYKRLLAQSLLRAPAIALLGDFAALIAVKSLKAPAWEVAVLTAAFPLGNLLAVFWSKRIAHAPRVVPYAFWPEILTSVLLVLMVFARDSHTFTMGLCLYLLLRAPVLQAYLAILRANFPPNWRSSLVARVMALSELLAAASGIVFGHLLDFDPQNYRMLMVFVGALSMLGAYQIRRVRVHGEKRARPPYVLRGGFSWRRIVKVWREDDRFRRYEFSFALFGFANIMALPIMPLFLQNELGIDYANAGLVLITLPMIVDVVMLPFWGRKLDQHNPLLLRAIFNFIFCFGMLCYPLAHSLLVFALGRMIIAFVQGGSGLVWILGINYFARSQDVPLYMGIHQSLTGVRGLIAPFVGIALAKLTGSYRFVFFAAFVVMMIGTMAMVGEVIRERRRTGGRLLSFAEAESEGEAGLVAAIAVDVDRETRSARSLTTQDGS